MLKYLLSAALLVTTSVYAKDNGQYENVDPEIRNWFKNLRSPSGMPCCDIADGHYAQWRKSEFPNYEYDVMIENEWRPVPPEVIIRNQKNPVGEAVVWYVRQGANTYYIRCFILGIEV